MLSGSSKTQRFLLFWLHHIFTMAKDCGDNGPSGWLSPPCGGTGGGGVCWLPLEIFRLAMRSSNCVSA